ncbi:MAG TPA: c-type cytochrome [Novosphingobium sp.]|nr:c-type cytochrome [Novosphingobium sp.]
MPAVPARWLPLAAAGALLAGCTTDGPAPGAGLRGDPQRGRILFTKCVACHSLDTAARRGTGPHLAGIIGRKAGSLDGFAYSPLLRDSGFIWTEPRIEAWLKAPQSGFPGLCLPFTGFERAQDRRDLMAWLRQNPAPAPEN